MKTSFLTIIFGGLLAFGVAFAANNNIPECCVKDAICCTENAACCEEEKVCCEEIKDCCIEQAADCCE